MYVIIIFLIPALLVFFIDLFGFISYLAKADNNFVDIAFRRLDDEKKKLYKNLLLLKIVVLSFVLAFAIYFYIKQSYIFSGILVLIASLIISFYERIVREI